MRIVYISKLSSGLGMHNRFLGQSCKRLPSLKSPSFGRKECQNIKKPPDQTFKYTIIN